MEGAEPAFHVVLFQPEIPPNTGSVGRVCLAVGARLHLVGPLGFSIDDRTLKRAGLDYWHRVDCRHWSSTEAFFEAAPSNARMFYLSTKATRSYWDASFKCGDWLVFGCETRGLPESIIEEHRDTLLRIPMREGGTRSLNLATSVAIVVYEGLRQVGRGMISC